MKIVLKNSNINIRLFKQETAGQFTTLIPLAEFGFYNDA